MNKKLVALNDPVYEYNHIIKIYIASNFKSIQQIIVHLTWYSRIIKKLFLRTFNEYYISNNFLNFLIIKKKRKWKFDNCAKKC